VSAGRLPADRLSTAGLGDAGPLANNIDRNVHQLR